MTLRILEGSTFCICDDVGDFVEATHGFFAEDTRFLSRLNLTLNGKRPLLLTSNNVDYFSAAFYMRNPLAGGLAQDAVSVERRRFVGEGIQDFVVLQNQGMEPLELTREGEVEGGRVTFGVALEPHERWELQLDVLVAIDGGDVVVRGADRRFGDQL